MTNEELKQAVANSADSKTHFELGLYNQVNSLFPQSMDESRAYSIALQAFKDGEPYATVTVNLPNQLTDTSEMIGIKNAAYIDTNNYPWASQLIETGVAVDTGFKKRSGFCEYPLYQFNEDWLKSLKPLVADRDYSLYEKKYNEAMGIDTDVLDERADEMTVICVEPGKSAYKKTIGTGLESLQHEVDGCFEAIYPFEDEVAIICNEEGKITGLPLNRALRDEDGEPYDIIAGNFLIVGLTEENFGSLSPEQVKTYLEKYKTPELFLRIDGDIKAIPSDRPDQIPVYLNGPDYAYDHREQSAYRQSFRANLQCKSAIEAALSENYANNTLNTERVWQQVTGTFGKERVVALLASTCCELKHDGRISNANIAWAADQPMLPDRIVIEKPHIGLVDLLATRARKEMTKEKKSVLEKLEAAKSNLTPTAPKTAKMKEQSL